MELGEQEISVQIGTFVQFLEKQLEAKLVPHPTTTYMRVGIGKHDFCADLDISFNS